MLAAVAIIAAAGAGAVLASWFMWWATKRSAIWAMFAGALLAVAVFAATAVGLWLYSRASFGR